jgi:hypothetical protein
LAWAVSVPRGPVDGGVPRAALPSKWPRPHSSGTRATSAARTGLASRYSFPRLLRLPPPRTAARRLLDEASGAGSKGRLRAPPWAPPSSSLPSSPSFLPSLVAANLGVKSMGGAVQGVAAGDWALIGGRLGFGAPEGRRGSSASVPRGTRRASGGGATAMGGAAPGPSSSSRGKSTERKGKESREGG